MTDLLIPTDQPKRRYRHGHKKAAGASPEYIVWRAMVARCTNDKNPNYVRYGARGIRVCERWRNDFMVFLEDMGRRPAGLSLERRDNDGDYTPENCVWATASEQANNRRSSRLISFAGKTMTLAQWSRATGIGVSSIHFRLKKGWPVDRALSTPVRRRQEAA